MGGESDRITVLHVDDDPGFVDVVSAFFEQEAASIETVAAGDAAEAFDVLAETDPDCIVSGYDMPGMDGIAFLSELRERGDDRPFVLFTGTGSEEVVSEAISAGVTDYLQKGSADRLRLLANRVVEAVGKARAERRAERSLDALESATEGIAVLDSDGAFVYLNQAYADTFGYEPAELVGEHWSVLCPDDDVDRARNEIIPAVPDEGRWTGETVHVREDGERIVVDHALARSDDALVCTVGEIVAESVSEPEPPDELLDRFVGGVDEYAVFLLDPDGYVTYWNDGAERIEGYAAEEVVGEHFSTFFPLDRQAAGVPTELLDRATEAGSVTRQGRRVRKGGDTYRAETTVTALFDDGTLRGFGAVVDDRTAREHYRKQLEGLHGVTRALVSASEPETIAETVVAAARNLLDLPISTCWLYDEADDVLRPVASTAEADATVGDPPVYDGEGSLSWEAFRTGEPAVFDDLSTVQGRLDTETSIRSEIVLPLGEYGVVNVGATESGAFDETEVSLARILAANAETALALLDRETRLREEEEFVSAALDALDDAFYVFDADRQPIRWNDSLPARSGYTDAEIAEMGLLDFFEGADRDRVAGMIDELFAAGHARTEADLVTKAGDRIPMEFTGSRLADSDGEIIGFAGVGRDVSERRVYERRLERQNERLEEFASAVSHDLRNPLGVAMGRLELAREACESEHYEAIERAHGRMDELIDDLLTRARNGSSVGDVAPVALADAAAAAWRSVDTAAATLTVETDRTLPADETRLRQLLENLFRNAVEHGGSEVTVTVGDHPDGFHVADDGPGVPPDDREAVFETGYSTSDQGTGFGLSIVADVAANHGWDVTLAESDAGGTRFEFDGIGLAAGGSEE